MIEYRCFRNSDTPQLVDIWRSQPRQRGLAYPMSIELFEQHVLAKPYFENQGLILAIDDGRPVGFIHAGFGPTEDEQRLCHRFGVTGLLLLRSDYHRLEIAGELLSRAEVYLRRHGAEVLYGGGIRPLNPFYQGLYGGAEVPGVLISDAFTHEVYQAAGYCEIDRALVLERPLADFRAPIDRAQMQVRRAYGIQEVSDPTPRNWWEACSLERMHVLRYDLVARGAVLASATARFCLLETFSVGWGSHAAGLIELEVASDRRRQGLATFLLSDAFRRLAEQGIALIEAQTMAGNAAARGLYAKLNFREVDQGVIYRKPGSA